MPLGVQVRPLFPVLLTDQYKKHGPVYALGSLEGCLPNFAQDNRYLIGRPL